MQGSLTFLSMFCYNAQGFPGFKYFDTFVYKVYFGSITFAIFEIHTLRLTLAINQMACIYHTDISWFFLSNHFH